MKKQLFIVITATITMVSLHTKVKAAPAVETMSRTLSLLLKTPFVEKKVIPVFMKTDRATDYPAVFNKTLFDDDWYGLVLTEKQGKLTDDQIFDGLRAAALNNTTEMNKIFRTDVGSIHKIIMRQLTWLYDQDPDIGGKDKNFISEESALEVIESLQVVDVDEAFWDGNWIPLRYDKNGVADDSRLPSVKKDKILCVNGDISKPAFRRRCLNPIAGPYKETVEPEPKKKKETTTEEETEKWISRSSPGGILIVNNNHNENDNDNKGSENGGQQVQRKEKGTLLKDLGLVALGFGLKWVLDQRNGMYYQRPIDYRPMSYEMPYDYPPRKGGRNHHGNNDYGDWGYSSHGSGSGPKIFNHTPANSQQPDAYARRQQGVPRGQQSYGQVNAQRQMDIRRQQIDAQRRMDARRSMDASRGAGSRRQIAYGRR